MTVARDNDSPQVGLRTGILTRIRAVAPTLTVAHQRVAERILADPGAVASATITELAERCETSLTTITRFCRELDLPGYAELRLALATEVGRDDGRDRGRPLIAFSPEDPMSKVVASLVASDTRSMEDTAAQLDLAAVERAVAALSRARTIDVYAVSGSAGVAMDVQLRLHSIGRPCHLWKDVHDAICSANVRDHRDVALAVSHSGATAEVVEPIRVARERGATTIVITNFPRSPLADAADILLTTAAQDAPFRVGGLAARHTQMLILDCLYIGVVQRTLDASEQAMDRAAAALSRHRLPIR